MINNVKDKDKLIMYLEKRCVELWEENEKLKFKLFIIENGKK